MEPIKVAESTRRQLDALPPEKRAAAEAILARTRTPEYRAKEAADRAILDEEYRRTGRIAVTSTKNWYGLDAFMETLRRQREAKGLSLADVAERSGMDKAALSRLETGQQPNPTLETLDRYARALGKRLRWSLEDAPEEPEAR